MDKPTKLGDLRPPKGAKKRRKILGRGNSSGHGTTAGRGNKGYGSRSGSKRRAGFEGGQMPLYRRLPKRGFKNPFSVKYDVVNVTKLNGYAEGESVTIESLKGKGYIPRDGVRVKILGVGEVDRKLEVSVQAVSKTAREKIEKVGGTVTLIGS